MLNFYRAFNAAFGDLIRAYIVNEDPDERRKRLQEKAREEIDAELPRYSADAASYADVER